MFSWPLEGGPHVLLGSPGVLSGLLILSFAMIMLYLYGVEYRGDLLSESKNPEMG